MTFPERLGFTCLMSCIISKYTAGGRGEQHHQQHHQQNYHQHQNHLDCFFQVSIISDEDCAAQTSSSVKNIKIFKIIKIIKIISYEKSQFFRTIPPRMLCVSSHFWLFTKANLILVSFDKKLWLGHNHPQPPHPCPQKHDNHQNHPDCNVSGDLHRRQRAVCHHILQLLRHSSLNNNFDSNLN